MAFEVSWQVLPGSCFVCSVNPVVRESRGRCAVAVVYHAWQNLTGTTVAMLPFRVHETAGQQERRPSGSMVQMGHFHLHWPPYRSRFDVEPLLRGDVPTLPVPLSTGPAYRQIHDPDPGLCGLGRNHGLKAEWKPRATYYDGTG